MITRNAHSAREVFWPLLRRGPFRLAPSGLRALRALGPFGACFVWPFGPAPSACCCSRSFVARYFVLRATRVSALRALLVSDLMEPGGPICGHCLACACCCAAAHAAFTVTGSSFFITYGIRVPPMLRMGPGTSPIRRARKLFLRKSSPAGCPSGLLTVLFC